MSRSCRTSEALGPRFDRRHATKRHQGNLGCRDLGGRRGHRSKDDNSSDHPHCLPLVLPDYGTSSQRAYGFSRAWISRTVLGQVKKGIVSDLTFRTYGGHQPVAPHFLCLYGLDSTQEPPETEVCALDLTRRDIPMAPSEPAIVPIQLTPAPTPSSVASPVSSQYEFSYSENSIIGNLGSKMSFVGLFMLGIGLFFCASVIMGWVQSQHLEVRLLFLSLLFIVVGIWTHRAGREFRNVAQTHGKDISHLMGGAGKPAQAIHAALPALFHRSGVRHHTAWRSRPVRCMSGRRTELARSARARAQFQGASGMTSPLSTA